MNFSVRFFKTISICAIIGGSLVFILWLLQFWISAPDGPEGLIALHGDIIYTASLWVNFTLVLFVLATMWGIAALKIKTAAGLVTTGFIFFLIDFISTLLFSSMRLFTLHGTWVPQLAGAADESARASVLAKMGAFNELALALYALIFVGALVGSFLFGMAMWKGAMIEKALSILFFVTFACNVLRVVGFYGSQEWLLPFANQAIPLAIAALMFCAGIRLRQGDVEQT